MRTLELTRIAPGLANPIYFGRLNSDERIDFIVAQSNPIGEKNPTVLNLFSSTPNGYSRQVIELPKEEFTFTFYDRVILFGDFNADSYQDFLIYDGSTRQNDLGRFRGVTPYLFEGNKDGKFIRTDKLKSVYEAVISTSGGLSNDAGRQADSTVHAKSGDVADIDGDGDLDIWVESNGGTNIGGHFLINKGGSFTVEGSVPILGANGRWDYNGDYRVPNDVYWGLIYPPPDALSNAPLRYILGKFVDFNNDSSPDLILGQLKREFRPNDQTSYLLLNDSAGRFLQETYALPMPKFNGSQTKVEDAIAIDLDGDNENELVLCHVRFPGGNVDFYIQVIKKINNAFVDVTDLYLKDQSAWSDRNLVLGTKKLIKFDVNNDGSEDILLNYSGNYQLPNQVPKVLLSSEKKLIPFSVEEIFGSVKDFEPMFQEIDGNGKMDFIENIWTSNQGAGEVMLRISYDLWNQKGGSSSDSLNGNVFAELLDGQEGNDSITGFAGNDTIFGGSGSDTLIGGLGDDTINGGTGVDIVVFQGRRSEYQLVSRPNTGHVISDSTTSRDGTDVLIEVERVRFSDGIIALDIKGIAGKAYRIYKAAFNRTPDGGGLGYWIVQMDKGMDVVEVAARFIDSPEFRSLYGTNPSNAEFLTKVYSNVLDRTPDEAGLAWWVNEMKTNPAKSWQKVLADFSESTENQANVASLIANGIAYDPWL
jgi:hypothetical protein